jgi:ADP-ribose pyrophosphatase
MTRVPLLEHPESVTLVVLDGDELVLVRQSRRGAGSVTLELPAGTMEPGETPEQTAARELAEECGLAAATLERVGGFWVVPAYSTEYTHVFEARDLSAASGVPDDDEDIAVERRSIDGLLGQLSDAGSIAALALWLERRVG